LIKIDGDPLAPSIEPPGPLAEPNLQIAATIIEVAGGTLRKIATSVSTEPRIAFEVEFPASRNPLTVEQT
jgi:hypothetical protein